MENTTALPAMRTRWYQDSAGTQINDEPFSPRKWLNLFFTHIHDYDEDYSSDLLELLPHNLKQKGIL